MSVRSYTMEKAGNHKCLLKFDENPGTAGKKTANSAASIFDCAVVAVNSLR